MARSQLPSSWMHFFQLVDVARTHIFEPRAALPENPADVLPVAVVSRLMSERPHLLQLVGDVPQVFLFPTVVSFSGHGSTSSMGLAKPLSLGLKDVHCGRDVGCDSEVGRLPTAVPGSLPAP